jgi:hypothetical protein
VTTTQPDIDTVVLRWPEVLERVEGRLRLALNEMHPIEIVNDTIVLACASTHQRHQATLAAGISVVRYAITETYGMSMDVCAVIDDRFMPKSPQRGLARPTIGSLRRTEKVRRPDCEAGSPRWKFDQLPSNVQAALTRWWIDAIEGVSRLRAQCESPAEETFWDAWIIDQGWPTDLVPAWRVAANGRNYRLDFADQARMVFVEIDGFTYHKDQEHIANDRRRQRDLQADGWLPIRFTAKEVTDDPQRCVRATLDIASRR